MPIIEKSTVEVLEFNITDMEPTLRSVAFKNCIAEIWRNAEGQIDRTHAPAVFIRHQPGGNIVGTYWFQQGCLHRNDGPAMNVIWDGLAYEQWHRNGELHRVGGPARTVTDIENGSVVISEEWRLEGKLHRENLPSKILRSLDTNMPFSEAWYCAGRLHREAGPAVVFRDKSTGVVLEEEWMFKGLMHRDDGPAQIYRNEDTGRIERQSFFRCGIEVRASVAEAGSAFSSPLPD
ncbi:hypothetical protein [Stakelama tenebrarum]|uniref:Uncharacterized protein n=1 Tax=Stakelama tenebrarum TaxID=2711215 RepID=A0A6G6Y559_9SPHN|nr:hypothetical protein [Sphingosinithalassobacter tenebrarum]QIG79937.1 hypothetical protein G5C33_09215 [Sphingosinithalassobacter tenebrarum]